MKKCKFCGEDIQNEAKKCRFCGEWVDKQDSTTINDNKNKTTLQKQTDLSEIKDIKKIRFFDKYGKKILYGIGLLILFLGFSDISMGKTEGLYYFITGLSVIFSLLAYSSLIERIQHQKPTLKKELTFLLIIIILLIISFSLPFNVINNNPLIIIPGILFLLVYLYVIINHYIKKYSEEYNNIISIKVKIINFFTYLFLLIITTIISFFYVVSDNKLYSINNNIDEFLNSFIGTTILVYLICIYIYIKGRGKLGGTVKSNILLVFRGLYGVIIIYGLLGLVTLSNNSINNENTLSDLENISKSIKDYNGNNDELISNINNTKTNSVIGNNIKEYMTKKNNLFIDYSNKINLLGDLVLDIKNYKNNNEINNVISNLNKLGEISNNYTESINELNKVYSDITSQLKGDNTIEINKKNNDFFESEKKFIKSSIEAYNYLLLIQNDIEIDEEGNPIIYDDVIRNNFNELIEIMNNNITDYQNKTSELEKLREETINSLNK